MTTLRCVDGPLAGQLVTRRRLPPPGRPVTVGLVDVGHAVLAVDYRVDDGRDRAPVAGALPGPRQARDAGDAGDVAAGRSGGPHDGGPATDPEDVAGPHLRFVAARDVREPRRGLRLAAR